MIWNRLPTRDNLRRRNIIGDQADVSCAFCKNASESIDHIFLECGFIAPLWYRCFEWMEIQSVISNSIANQFLLMWGMFKEKKKRKLLLALWSGLIWVVWNKRNEAIFKTKLSIRKRRLMN